MHIIYLSLHYSSKQVHHVPSHYIFWLINYLLGQNVALRGKNKYPSMTNFSPVSV